MNEKQPDPLLHEFSSEHFRRAFNELLKHERLTTGVDRRHWSEKTVIGEEEERA